MRREYLLPVVLAAVVAACGQARTPAPPAAATSGGHSRQELFDALRHTPLLDPDRQLVHLSHTCTLRVDNRDFPVVDVQELSPGAATARGINHIVVFDASLTMVRAVEYTTERPLFCRDNALFVWGDLAVDNQLPEGNRLTFSNGAKDIAVDRVEVNHLPIPRTGDRKDGV
jgi:hypothetical protein